VRAQAPGESDRRATAGWQAQFLPTHTSVSAIERLCSCIADRIRKSRVLI
jgi:hypothetical protein